MNNEFPYMCRTLTAVTTFVYVYLIYNHAAEDHFSKRLRRINFVTERTTHLDGISLRFTYCCHQDVANMEVRSRCCNCRGINSPSDYSLLESTSGSTSSSSDSASVDRQHQQPRTGSLPGTRRLRGAAVTVVAVMVADERRDFQERL